MKIVCPNCESTLNVKGDWAGRTSPCPKCSALIQFSAYGQNPHLHSDSNNHPNREQRKIQKTNMSGWVKLSVVVIIGAIIGFGIFYLYPITAEATQMKNNAIQLSEEKAKLIQENINFAQQVGDLKKAHEQLSKENGDLTGNLNGMAKENQIMNQEKLAIAKQFEAVDSKLLSSRRAVDNLQNKNNKLIKLDDNIISKYNTAIAGIIVAYNTNNAVQILDAMYIAYKALEDIEQLMISRNALLKY